MASLARSTAPARDKVQADPSGDDFRYFLDSKYDQEKAQILQRYKDYNGTDGNSPISANNSTVSYSSYLTPDNEDLNSDNTLSTSEEYYEYNIDLQPGKLELDKEYIVDKITLPAIPIPRRSQLPGTCSAYRYGSMKKPLRQYRGL